MNALNHQPVTHFVFIIQSVLCIRTKKLNSVSKRFLIVTIVLLAQILKYQWMGALKIM